MRTLSAALQAAVNAVVTAPGHLVELAFDPVPARWSDIGTIALPDGRIFAGVDMKIGRLGFNGDAAPGQFGMTLGNLDSSVGALLLANDVASVRLSIWACDRDALAVADIVPLGSFSITQARIGVDRAEMTCAPIHYTAPFRRVDAANGFTHAIPEGTTVVWGAYQVTLTQDSGADHG